MSKNVVKDFSSDISDEEWEKIHLPLQKNLDNFMTKYIIPEVVAFQIANAYSRGGLCEATFEQHYNSMSDIINGSRGTCMKVADNIFDILKIKYNLIITDDSPMKVEKWQ